MLLGLDIPNPTCPISAQLEAPSLACPEPACLGLFDLIVEASLPTAWQEQSSLELRVGEGEAGFSLEA